MIAKTVIPRAQAERDVNDALDYYLREASPAVALGFIETLENAYRVISEQPGVGSSRYAYELAIPGLRSWTLRGYPYVVFYAVRDDHIDVWRVLNGASDIPVWMAGEER